LRAKAAQRGELDGRRGVEAVLERAIPVDQGAPQRGQRRAAAAAPRWQSSTGEPNRG
jgi:hypothetical protein